MSSSSSSTTTTSTMTTTRRRKLTQRKTFAGTFTLANEGAQSFGWDGLFAAWFPLVFVVVLATAHWLRNPWFALWFAFGLLPVLDLVVPMDEANPTPEDEKKYANALSYRVPLYVWTVAQTAIFFWAVHHFCTSPEMLQASLSHQIGFVLAVGVLGGLGINVSHELVHKVRSLDRACAYVLLCLVNYMHFALEHRSGHHKNVSTPLDPASARKGQNVYGFYLQSVVGGWRSAWEIECTRLERMGVSKWSTENVMLWFAGCPAVLAAALGFHFGPRAVVFFFIQGWVAHVLLEAINMIEHYALERKEVSPGVYEPVSILHSWNAPHRITNMFLMKLQRHSDHHAHAMRPYHLLRSFEESPMLPTGYAGCTLMALASPIWSNVMDPLAAAYTDPKTDPAAKQATIRSAVRKTTAFSWATFFVLSYVCLF